MKGEEKEDSLETNNNNSNKSFFKIFWKCPLKGDDWAYCEWYYTQSVPKMLEYLHILKIPKVLIIVSLFWNPFTIIMIIHHIYSGFDHSPQ